MQVNTKSTMAIKTSSVTTPQCSSYHDPANALFNNKRKSASVHDPSCFFGDVPASVGQDELLYPASAPGGTSRQTSTQIIEIIELAESVIDDGGALLCSDDEEQQALAPTPIGPLGITVVDNIPLEGCTQKLDLDFAKILAPLFLRKRKSPLAAAEVGVLMNFIISEASIYNELQEERPKEKNTRHANKMSPTSMVEAHHTSEEVKVNPFLRFRSYQVDLWDAKFEELAPFQKRFGHCLVPHNWAENIPLAQWVKRQRCQYKLKMRGMHSNMTTKRERMLEDLGFIWNSHEAVWEEHLNALHDFSKTFGHCNVPSSYAKNLKLSTWVKAQRRQYKHFRRGEKRSTMAQDRMEKLTHIGFVWNPRNMELSRPPP